MNSCWETLLRFNLQRLRSLFVLPVIFLLVLMLSSLLVGFGIIYFTLASHLRGDLLYFENQYVEFTFPKNWYAPIPPFEYANSTLGSFFSAVLIAPEGYLVFTFTIYDETAAQTLTQKFNLTDARSVVNFEVNTTYNDVLQYSSNASLIFLKNDTIMVSSCTADYSICLIKNGYTENNVTKNMRLLTISFFDKRRLVQIAYWGNEEDFNSSYPTFVTTVLSEIRVKA